VRKAAARPSSTPHVAGGQARLGHRGGEVRSSTPHVGAVRWWSDLALAAHSRRVVASSDVRWPLPSPRRLDGDCGLVAGSS
jgi:hypothetical protein